MIELVTCTTEPGFHFNNRELTSFSHSFMPVFTAGSTLRRARLYQIRDWKNMGYCKTCSCLREHCDRK